MQSQERYWSRTAGAGEAVEGSSRGASKGMSKSASKGASKGSFKGSSQRKTRGKMGASAGTGDEHLQVLTEEDAQDMYL